VPRFKQFRKKRSLRLFGHKKAKNYDSKDYEREPPVMPPAGTTVLHFFLFLFCFSGGSRNCQGGHHGERTEQSPPVGSRGRENLPLCPRQTASCSCKPTTNLSFGHWGGGGGAPGPPIAGSTTGLFVILYIFTLCQLFSLCSM